MGKKALMMRIMSAVMTFRPIATFSGLHGVPLITLTHNAIYPAVTVGPDGVTITVVRRHHLPWANIREVTLRRWLAWQVTIRPGDSRRTFIASFFSRREVSRLLAAMSAHGAALDEAATELITTRRRTGGGGP